jgi:retron-type reverse transcriptase
LFSIGTGHETSFLSSFDYITSTVSLFAAWAKFRRGKRSRLDVLVYERHLEENIFNLQRLLIRGRYKHGSYRPFMICDPKQRQIHKATVQDRLVHQAIVSAIDPLFEPRFIFDSYSCRKTKGTHAAVSRLRKFLRQASGSDSRTVYSLKCDIKQFFASVDHQILMNLLKKRINDPRTIELLQEVIDSLCSSPGKGIPLGNLTSQLFANVYMHEFDWFVKNQLREKHYLRYCDDFIILSTHRQHLLDLVPILTEFLRDRLALTVHPNKIQVRSWRQGVDFLGYVVKPHSVVLRHKTKLRSIQRVNAANLSSYLGLCTHANEYRLGQLLVTKAATSKEV